jgi:hypothetical protein
MAQLGDLVGHECQAMGWQRPVTNGYAQIFAFASQAHWP